VWHLTDGLTYQHDFAGEKEGLSEENAYSWDNYEEISGK